MRANMNSRIAGSANCTKIAATTSKAASGHAQS